MKEILFAIMFMDGDLVLNTTPKKYWEKHHALYDIGGTGDKAADKALNNLGWYEEMESTFSNEKRVSLKKAKEALINAGFIHSEEMEKWLKGFNDENSVYNDEDEEGGEGTE